MDIKAIYLNILKSVLDSACKSKLDAADCDAMTRLRDLIRHAGSKSALELVDSVQLICESRERRRYVLSRLFWSDSELMKSLKSLINDPCFSPQEVFRIENEELDRVEVASLKAKPARDQVVCYKATRNIYKKTEIRKLTLIDTHDRLERMQNKNMQFLKNTLGYFKSTELRIEDEEQKVVQLKQALEDLGVDNELYSNSDTPTKNRGPF